MKILIMKKLTILFSLFCGLLVSCSRPELEGGVLIRVNNQTGRQLDNVSIFSHSADWQSERENRYGSVSPGSVSAYGLHQRVYDFPLFTFNMSGLGIFESREIRCGTGLGELSPGKYSLVIMGENDSPFIHFIKD
jgi:hypothetical protein